VISKAVLGCPNDNDAEFTLKNLAIVTDYFELHRQHFYAQFVFKISGCKAGAWIVFPQASRLLITGRLHETRAKSDLLNNSHRGIP
jgi:hypothetical protein